MSQREKILAGMVAAMVLLWGATEGLARYRTALDRNEQEALDVQQELSRARTASLRGRRAERLVRDWERQSLPTNLDIAKSLYQDWLRTELDESLMIVKELREHSPRTSRKHYRQATFIATAQGSLEKLTDFLYRFYQSPHLHRISSATITPTSSRKSLTVTLTIDALSLPGCPRKDTLAEGSSEMFADSLETIEGELVSRNIFMAYEPPKPPEPPQDTLEAEVVEEVAEGPDTDAASAYITSMTHGAGGWQVSVRMVDSGKLFYYRQGDSIEIGRFSGEILKLDGRRAIIDSDEGPVEIYLGQNLSQARAVPGGSDI